MTARTTSLRALPKQTAQPEELDGGDDMYPLRDIKTVAKRLGCSTDLVIEFMREGSLPYVQLGGKCIDPESPHAPRRWRVRNDRLNDVVRDWSRD
ncbi:hypothetical protein [Kineosporia babensis]|uniref:Uncharacterized protein n=1 Tax=Kineosporia babensis TaxID=499548 RepID=A0A9X1STV2_9ACTN|nr:hypothetical protein [Kineosporia babensis]MCD5310945.1 hypothetical protein [Kineosporia babensis]